jgi:hypothetical protein
LDEFCFQAACDGKDGVQPIDPKRALIELVARATLDAVFEDGDDVKGVVAAVMARFRELFAQVERS